MRMSALLTFAAGVAFALPCAAWESSVRDDSYENLQEDFKTQVFPIVDRPSEQGFFTGVAGKKISYVTYVRDEAAPRIVLVNGRTVAYLQDAELIADLQKAGFSVFDFDHRGQGRSDRVLADPSKKMLGHVEAFDDYVEDLTTFLTKIVKPSPSKQTYILGTSMGGAVSLKTLLQNQGRFGPDKIQRLALLGPMVGIRTGVPRFLLDTLLGFVDFTGPAIGQSTIYRTPKFEGNPLCSSPARFRRHYQFFDDSPDVAIAGASYGWVREAGAAGDEIMASVQGEPKVAPLGQPVLLIQAEKDTIVDNATQGRFCDTLVAAKGQCKLLLLKGARHGIMLETNVIRNQAMTALLEFFQ